MNNWNSITIKISREAEEAISALLIEAGSAGVEINDSADYLNHEDQFGEVYPKLSNLNSLTSRLIIQKICQLWN